MVCSAGDIKERVRAETSSGCSKGTERGASGRRVVSVEWIEGAIEGAAEKGTVKAEGVCVQFSVNGASNQLLVGLLKGIVTNGSVAE